ncbi:MAG: hypothetical protein MRJ96_08285 [Nitrospirales bacterium]|nr:hypothetical protein [Nitrospira sp.]MDR4501430.1 hypothetical protein [Nitrospirales bacterium]
MIETMGIARSSEAEMYLLRDGECLWRIDHNGQVECTAQGKASVFTFLYRVREWKLDGGDLTL